MKYTVTTKYIIWISTNVEAEDETEAKRLGMTKIENMSNSEFMDNLSDMSFEETTVEEYLMVCPK